MSFAIEARSVLLAATPEAARNPTIPVAESLYAAVVISSILAGRYIETESDILLVLLYKEPTPKTSLPPGLLWIIFDPSLASGLPVSGPDCLIFFSCSYADSLPSTPLRAPAYLFTSIVSA